jgi:hypothetical protein
MGLQDSLCLCFGAKRHSDYKLINYRIRTNFLGIAKEFDQDYAKLQNTMSSSYEESTYEMSENCKMTSLMLISTLVILTERDLPPNSCNFTLRSIYNCVITAYNLKDSHLKTHV